MTPTIARHGPYRFFFYSNEDGEPAHVHVQRDNKLAKFWLIPVSLASSRRFAAHELTQLAKIVAEKSEECLEAWHGYFGD